MTLKLFSLVSRVVNAHGGVFSSKDENEDGWGYMVQVWYDKKSQILKQPLLKL